MLGRSSAGRVWSWHKSGRVCLGTGYFLRHRGAIHPGFTPFGGLGLLPGTWDVPNKGNADGTIGIFGNVGRVWALPYDRTHLKKALCLIRPVVGRMINTRSQWNISKSMTQMASLLRWINKKWEKSSTGE